MPESLHLHEKNKISFLLFPRWEKEGFVGHGFSTRLGGSSTGPFAGLNLGLKGGDDPGIVAKNRQRFLNVWGKSTQDLFYGEQVHGKNVFRVTAEFIKQSVREIPATDALVTAEKQVLLGAFSADCLLVILLDRKTPAVGIAHAGWRGTLGGILAAVVQSMENNFQSEPGSLEVLMGPAIGPCCYAVGKEVLDFCAGSPWGKEAVFYPGPGPENPFLDLQRTNRNILCRAGVQPANIFMNGYCTHCRGDLFYSYRGAGGVATGSQMGIIYLK